MDVHFLLFFFFFQCVQPGGGIAVQAFGFTDKNPPTS
jgi:hypothetical protein